MTPARAAADLRFDLTRPVDSDLALRVTSDARLKPLLPFIHDGVRQHGVELPPDVRERLRVHHAANGLRCILRHEELARRLEDFAAGSIAAIPLKGTFLAARLYGGVGGRTLGGDLDILIRRADAKAAAQVLEGAGYQPRGPSDQYDRPFVRETSGPDSPVVMLELHTDLLPGWFLASGFTDAAWSRATPPASPDSAAWTLDPIDETLHLCAHLVKDQVETVPRRPQLRHALDLHLVLTRWGDRIDWGEFRRRARTFRLHTHAALAFAFVSYRFGTVAPPELARALPEWKRACFERWIWDRDPASLRSIPLGKQLRLLALTLLLDDDWRARWGHLGWASAEAFRRGVSSPG